MINEKHILRAHDMRYPAWQRNSIFGYAMTRDEIPCTSIELYVPTTVLIMTTISSD
jgi:hypothetical protein